MHCSRKVAWTLFFEWTGNFFLLVEWGQASCVEINQKLLFMARQGFLTMKFTFMSPSGSRAWALNFFSILRAEQGIWKNACECCPVSGCQCFHVSVSVLLPASVSLLKFRHDWTQFKTMTARVITARRPSPESCWYSDAGKKGNRNMNETTRSLNCAALQHEMHRTASCVVRSAYYSSY